MITFQLFILAMIQMAESIVAQAGTISKLEEVCSLNSKVLIPMSVQEISTYTNSSILGVYGITVLQDGSFIVADKLDYKIKRFDPKGRLISEAGRRGRGPGEFTGPVSVTASKNRIAVSDLQSSRVQLFSLDMQFLNEFYVSGPIITMRYDNQDNLWVGILSHGTNEALLQVDSDGMVQRSIRLKNTTRNSFENLFNFVVRRDNRICVLFACQNVIEIWNTEGTLEKEVTVPGFPPKPRWVRATQSSRVASEHSLLPEGMLFFKFCNDSQGKMYFVGEEYAHEPQRDVFVLDDKGQLMGIFQLPRKSSWIYMDSQDYLWSIEEHRTRVTKYKILPQEANSISKQR